MRTLLASRKAICEAQDLPLTRPQRKETGIGRDSLRMTVGSLVRTAEAAFKQFEQVDENGTPDDIANWLFTQGKTIFKAFVYLIGDLLSERNLHDLVQKLEPLG